MWNPGLRRLPFAFPLTFLLISPVIAQEYKEYPANRVSGVNVDQFIGYWNHSETTVTHGTLIERIILRAGDPERPTWLCS